MRVGQAVDHVTGRPGAAGISPILGQPFFSNHQMGLWHRDLTRSSGDAVPKSLQVPDLFRLREGAKPRGFGEGRPLSPALSWS
jgi:hypothetical protein